MSIADRFAAFVDWLKTEPVVVHYLAALLITAALHFGVSLSDATTSDVGILAGVVATWAARRKVGPWKPPVDVQGVIDAAYSAGKNKQAKPKP